MRIIRFIDGHGNVVSGEDTRDGSAIVLDGSVEHGFTRTRHATQIIKLLAPIIPADIICIGRNYPPAPVSKDDDATLEVFLKPSTALLNPGDPILLPRFDGVADIQ